MKYSRLLAVVITCVSLGACSSDTPDHQEPPQSKSNAKTQIQVTDDMLPPEMIFLGLAEEDKVKAYQWIELKKKQNTWPPDPAEYAGFLVTLVRSEQQKERLKELISSGGKVPQQQSAPNKPDAADGL